MTAVREAPERSAAPAPPRARLADHVRGWFSQVRRLLGLPVASYYLILFAVLVLTGFGLVMVLSASSITSYDGGKGSSFSIVARQGAFALGGLALMFACSRAPVRLWQALAPWAMAGGLIIQVLPLLPGLGATVNGNRSWIHLGSLQLQPAEFVKLALALFLGAFLGRRIGQLTRLRALLPIVLTVGASVGLVLLGHDLGTGIILMLTAAGALFVGGLRKRYLLLFGAGAVALVGAMVLTSANRMSRIQAVITGHATEGGDSLGDHWQSDHGLYALASGGWTGVGLGASREKWSWLPEAHNDFIFAIVGEELGLLGTFAVIGVFVILACGLVRVICRTSDRMVQATTGGIFLWIIGQAAVNIGVVCGILPVIGVPLPFVSYGGSSLISTLLAAGIVLSFARAEPGAAEALRRRGASVRASLSIFARQPRGN
ncbi:putative lipid II flippase FtsW [Brevibacterium sp. 5221]|uniref:Probable peptidoglycan glycosyltransferase FtsW n=1 Tax=Brevibacterium rongguiense TaxID=2695267 RepID=A0A6N9H933_9MICO|nr:MULTISPECIES: putative lipid II flippase FtsW [Brevibacterium]MYM20341.1 putative lipid II flippase FtsW [Brevibacterium rongguiense]WAL41084.1 putative lipid II flippase FtsW [Brevibacterium sp. BRM-1]